ncbi:MAG: bacterial transcriptional activator domain-containing protein [Proteobacteria bacterium]|nr:bacterial transcriptional activator domain-containing protein [Pseudomonadota bacterium]MBU1451387.1 bacterial transcriptional activator domain-containing protein [Pseudomonadota bacterium]MBU2467586.1 bacterial transcriptional activator domain-containing protein [Pseudomonadota bacterium]MBU2519509.1 bacterial transcriptional activator domain-containing protein [Pseudomonadota bacterium]
MFLAFCLLLAGWAGGLPGFSALAHAGCISVTCFDGSNHPCGFDCRSLLPKVNRGTGKWTTVSPPQPKGPSPQELERLRGMALDEANETGIAAYNRGDYARAVAYFARALEYDPHNPNLQHNLKRARQRLDQQDRQRREALRRSLTPPPKKKALQEAAAAAAHGKQAAASPQTAKDQGGKVFDYKGGKVPVAAITPSNTAQPRNYDAILGKGVKVPKQYASDPGVVKMQKQRAALVKEYKEVDQDLAFIKKKKQQYPKAKGKLEVLEAEMKQKQSDVKHKIGYVDYKMNTYVIDLTKGKKSSSK